MDDATTRTGTADVELLAELRGRRQWVLGMFAVVWLVLAALQLAGGNVWVGSAQVVLALAYAALWWFSPRPHVQSVTEEALVLRRSTFCTRAIHRAQIDDVQAKYLGAYGLRLTLQDGETIDLPGRALQYEVAAAQAAALRRWAGLDDPVS
ncbi:hypothetical protein [uncultured Modestobacter sp.]|uniref:hypothetical protein n=1 Tax=uncultured Modestobacter sp. TaxID=380048 RepID=UPI0026213C3B|nr:hypothetical protein [uncultured Modestobacter sp.]